MIFLYPSDYFDPKRADDLFEAERKVALTLGHGVVLFDFDSGKQTDLVLPTSYVPKSSGLWRHDVLYRGWQMPPERYEEMLYPLMLSYGDPVTSPEQYALLHSSEGYAPHVRDLMPASMSLSYNDVQDASIIDEVFDTLGEMVFVKDYVKSVYGMSRICRRANETWRAAVRSTLEGIHKARGADFAGGYTFKELVDFSEQVRLFVWRGEVIVACAHDGQWSGEVPDNVPTDLPSPFYTVDMAYSPTKGSWLVVECGDGQVSECEGIVEIEQMYAALG